MKQLALMLAAVAMIAACSRSETKTDDSAKQPAPVVVETNETVTSIWEWPAGAGNERDLSADHAACRETGTAADGTASMKKSLQRYSDCMTAKGWKRKAQ